MLAQNITLIEESLLCNFDDEVDLSQTPVYIKNIWEENWNYFLTKDIFINILKNCDNEQYLKTILNESNEEEIFCIGIASLLCFIQYNFTGPNLNNFTSNIPSTNIRKCLAINTEEIDDNVNVPELLLTAKIIFNNCLLNSNINLWWSLRYAIIQQQIIDETSETVFQNINNKISNLIDWDLNNRLKARLFLEISQFYLLFGHVIEAEKNLTNAKQLLQIDFDLTGELGKRTKFQQNDIAQIVLKVEINENISRQLNRIKVIPEIIKLDDDVRLDKIQFNKNQEYPQLSNIEQTVILTAAQIMQRSKPKDELLTEETDAFLSVLLQQNNCWTVRFNSLLLRCFLESKHKRTIERSLMQCESLVGNLNNDLPKAVDRISNFWSSVMQPKWKIEAHMASLMLNLGLIKAALDIFLKLQMWEEVIVCYTIMQLRHKSAEIIQTQLDEKPTVKLWCLLGDATDDISCYEKAWNLSEHKSSRAQRHWGQFLFARKEYTECIPHLQKSLEINSLQNMVWLRLGYAALEVEDWSLAATAYRRYTYLEPGGFEAWNNLAKAYIKLGEKSRAHYALQEALKYSFDNWKIWDNFMIVSAATKHFSDVIRAYHQILDLKEKHLDIELLQLVINDVLTNNEENSNHLNKVRNLFGRLTSLYPNESKLWELYSDLSQSPEVKAQRLYRAYRGLVQDDWSKNPEKCGIVLAICLRLAETTIEAKNISTTSSTRLTLRSVIAATKKQAWEQHEIILKQIEELLEKIVNLHS